MRRERVCGDAYNSAYTHPAREREPGTAAADGAGIGSVSLGVPSSSRMRRSVSDSRVGVVTDAGDDTRASGVDVCDIVPGEENVVKKKTVRTERANAAQTRPPELPRLTTSQLRGPDPRHCSLLGADTTHSAIHNAQKA
jgi:hypothetical protein